MRINAHKLKDLERKSRQYQHKVQEEQAAQAVKGVHFAEKYQHVQPKVTAYMKVRTSPGVGRFNSYTIYVIYNICMYSLAVV